jgi:hypothetical protein
MPTPSNPGTFKCPACRQRVRVEIKRGSWYWGKHSRSIIEGGGECALSGKRMA